MPSLRALIMRVVPDAYYREILAFISAYKGNILSAYELAQITELNMEL